MAKQSKTEELLKSIDIETEKHLKTLSTYYLVPSGSLQISESPLVGKNYSLTQGLILMGDGKAGLSQHGMYDPENVFIEMIDIIDTPAEKLKAVILNSPVGTIHTKGIAFADICKEFGVNIVKESFYDPVVKYNSQFKVTYHRNVIVNPSTREVILYSNLGKEIINM